MSQTRGKSGSVVEVSDKGQTDYTPFLVFGILSVVYGMSIFVYLPLALLNGNVGLSLTIFFMILLGMIVGLTILTANIQPLFEGLVVSALLCWEKVSMKQLILKNLVIHRANNKQTSMIYSLTVGTIIFLFVALAIQV